MDKIIYSNNKNKHLGKKEILYFGLVSVLIAVLIVFGTVFILGVDLLSCNMTIFVLAFFGVLFASWIILLLRNC